MTERSRGLQRQALPPHDPAAALDQEESFLSLPSAVIDGHPRHELTWVVHGSVVVEAAGNTWRLTPNRALWIPAGVAHTVTPQPGALVFPLWLDALRYTPHWQTPREILGTPFLSSLVQVLLQPGLAGDARAEQATHALHQLLPQLAHAGEPLPMPSDPRARAVAEGLLANPSTSHTLEEWAKRVHTSSKTLQRRFVDETHMAFPEWRATARLNASLPLLERGEQVSMVSARVGYASTSGFITAFRKRYGHTPAKHRSS